MIVATPVESLRPLVEPSVPARLTSPLKWPGGKRWLLPHLLPLWEPHRQRRLVEPFCGGMSISLGLRPERALLSDINDHLINFFNWLKQGLRLSIPMENEREIYYQHRERFNTLIQNGAAHSQEAAELFYYLNRTGYNGLCRFNRKGDFNVPFGRHRTILYDRDFVPYRNALANWDFLCAPFETIALQPDDFIYADPPYDVDFVNYSKEGFSWDDQVRLAEWLIKHPGPVVLSNQATERVVELYTRLGFTLREYHSPRRISCTGDRKPALEVLALKDV